MQTLKNILARRDERFNLQNATICVVAVLALVAVALWLANIELFLHSSPDVQVREPGVP